MPIVLIAAGAVVLYLLLNQGGVSAAYTNPYGAQRTLTVAPVGPNPQPFGPGIGGVGAMPTSGGGINLGAVIQTAGGSAASIGVSMASSAGAIGTTAAAAATAGIGVGLAIFTALWSAHEQRARQATSENQAMNAGVAGWDQAIKQINAAYNSGQADPQTCIQALMQILQNYWAEVTPVIQPGRNGCNSGAQCPVDLSNLYAGVLGQGAGYCSGSIGAACCVGCANLQVSTVYAIQAIQQGGGTSNVVAVVGSKYGGQARPAYTLNWRQG